jgi:protein-disulfide isomerase
LTFVLVLTRLPAAAQEPPSPPLVVTSAVADRHGDTVTLTGQHFGSHPFVTLDLGPLTVRSASDTQIVALLPTLSMQVTTSGGVGTLPLKLPPGTYLLTVSRGSAPGDSASVDLVLGAAAVAARDDVATEPGTTTPPGQGEVVAKVGDRVITLAEVDRAWRQQDLAGYLTLTQRLYEIRRKTAEALVTDELLALEAAARGVSADALLTSEVAQRMVSVPDVAVESFYRTLGDRAQGASLEQMKPALRAWLERRTAPEMARLNYLNELTKTSTAVSILLEPPRADIERTPQDAVLGPSAAPVEIVAFADFQSPEYARIFEALRKLRETFQDRLSIVFKPLPSSGRADAIMAAEAAQCAGAQDQFWAYHDALLQHQGTFDGTALKMYAVDLRLDSAAFDRCLEGRESRVQIEGAVREAARYGIQFSPTFLINGRRVPPLPPFYPPFEFFSRLVEEELFIQARKPPR